MLKNFSSGVLQFALLALVAFFLASAFNGRWTAEDWKNPIEYGVSGPAGDAKAQFAWIKAASEGHYPLFFSKSEPAFGAPFEANWDDFPVTEELHIVLPGLAARVIGLFPAVNLFVILAHVTAALGFFLACRSLKYRWEWSCAGALIFGFSLYIFGRSVHHLPVGWIGHIPLMILVARWAFTGVADTPEEKRGLLNASHFKWALAIAVLTGVQHVYYTNMLIQFLGLAALYQAFHRRWKSAIRAVLVGTVAMAAFLSMNLETIWSGIAREANPIAVARTYQYLEYSGFKLADLFIPPPDYPVPALADWGKRYFSEVILKGEEPMASYLGLAGIAAFLWLLAMGARNLAQETVKRPPWELLLLAWVVVYATVGGLNGWIGSLGFVLFRSTTRYTAFVLALALLFAVRKLSALTGRWTPGLRIGAAFVLTCLALADQVPHVAYEDPSTIAKAVHSDRVFAQEMESRLKPGAMVFQLPVMNFPESPIRGVPSYDHFRPFFSTKTLRYSFGDIKGHARNAWQDEAETLPPETLMQKLESYGFGALYLNTGGFADGGKSYLDAAEKRGAAVLRSPNGDLVSILLNPSNEPKLPPQAPYFGKGWYEIEGRGSGHLQRLCRGAGELVLTNPGTEPAVLYLQFLLQGVDDRQITMSLNGQSQNLPLKQGNLVQVRNFKVELKPGKNVVSFTTEKPGVPTMRGPIAFGIVDFHAGDEPVSN